MNKEAQAVQQELANLRKEMTAFRKEIADQGRAPTAAEQAALDRGTQQVDEVAALLADGYDIDPFKDTRKVVARVAKQGAEVQAVKGKTEDLEQRITRLEDENAELRSKTVWSDLQEKYPGIKVQEIFDKARAEAEEILGADVDPKAIRRLATRTMHDRAAAALRQKTGQPAPPIPPNNPPPSPPPAPTARRLPPNTPGGARVTDDTGGAPGAPLTAEQEQLADYRSLVVPD